MDQEDNLHVSEFSGDTPFSEMSNYNCESDNKKFKPIETIKQVDIKPSIRKRVEDMILTIVQEREFLKLRLYNAFRGIHDYNDEMPLDTNFIVEEDYITIQNSTFKLTFKLDIENKESLGLFMPDGLLKWTNTSSAVIFKLYYNLRIYLNDFNNYIIKLRTNALQVEKSAE